MIIFITIIIVLIFFYWIAGRGTKQVKEGIDKSPAPKEISSGDADILKHLDSMRKAGLITEAEYNDKKSKILNGM